MLEVLYNYFEQSFPLTENDRSLIQSVVSMRTIRKSEFLVRQGEVARHGAFVTKGILRSYLDFLETYPSIAQRVPQHMLASYLGLTPETVSRIRKQASLKK